ncbi:unnamed protein product [Bursaphelenchus xylophilus]|uniref:(pine wood nematode) hypothetical protein n=1 Tax=Bursaphelenchus xylophilus TaxID=6326 RepID=A0A1I7S1L2_BURXY|nr:unnamed protein product [Bursaphelenchus xylophilus]CAG9081311.1 unnamed protein product [Bursaphelenchus xylophilus]
MTSYSSTTDNSPATSSCCAICSDPVASQHFGVFSCRPCAAFFRRSIVLKRKYRCKREGKCKISPNVRKGCAHCRLNKCINVGMETKKIRYAFDKNGPIPKPSEVPSSTPGSVNNESSASELSNPLSKPLLPDMVAGYRKFLADTKTFHTALNPENIFKETMEFKMATVVEHTNFQKALIVYALKMLDDFYHPFGEFTREVKERLMKVFHLYFALLNQHYLNTLYFPNDHRKMFLHYGSYLDFGKTEFFFAWNETEALSYLSSLDCLHTKFAKLSTKFKAIMPDETEVAALSGIILWREVSTQIEHKLFESFPERIQDELGQYCKRTQGTAGAALRLGRVLGLLRDLEELALMMTEGMTVGTLLNGNFNANHPEIFQR